MNSDSVSEPELSRGELVILRREFTGLAGRAAFIPSSTCPHRKHSAMAGFILRPAGNRIRSQPLDGGLGRAQKGS